MTIKFNVTGTDRKALVKAICNITNETSKYLGAPSFEYQIGDGYIVSKNGDLKVSNMVDKAILDMLVKELYRCGFESESTSTKSVNINASAAEIQFSKTGFSETTIDNLKKLIASKANLIKKALGTETLEVTEYDDRIGFPWFHAETPYEDMIEYSTFLRALVKMAKQQKRVVAKEKPIDNEKYAFRCFLLRLGFIGNEYKAARKTLLRNFEGSSAFKSSKKNETAVN